MSDEVPEPRVDFAAATDLEAAVDAATAVLRRDGLVVLDNLVDSALMAQCLAEIEQDYPDVGKVDRAVNYGPYEGRHTATIVLEKTRANKDVLLPKAVTRIAERILGQLFVMDTYGLLVSIPGAPDQKVHADGHLFPEIDIEYMLPPFALAFALPLVTMDEASGRTAFWTGSHRRKAIAEQWDYAPRVEPGSAILWDFRTRHCGLANRTDKLRPVIYSILSRHWWVEVQPPEAVDYQKFLVRKGVREQFGQRLEYVTRRATVVD